MVTFDTITDEQIRALNASADRAEEIMSSATALGTQAESYPGHRMDARVRCVEILNARSEQDDESGDDDYAWERPALCELMDEEIDSV